MHAPDLIRILHTDGWRFVRWRGSHRQYQHPVKRGTVTVSVKAGARVTPGMLHSVFRRAGLTKDDWC